jgi:hypothetical protein
MIAVASTGSIRYRFLKVRIFPSESIPYPVDQSSKEPDFLPFEAVSLQTFA